MIDRKAINVKVENTIFYLLRIKYGSSFASKNDVLKLKKLCMNGSLITSQLNGCRDINEVLSLNYFTFTFEMT